MADKQLATNRLVTLVGQQVKYPENVEPTDPDIVEAAQALYNDLLALPSMQDEEEYDMSGCSDPEHCSPTFYADACERNEVREQIRKELAEYFGIKENL